MSRKKIRLIAITTLATLILTIGLAIPSGHAEKIPGQANRIGNLWKLHQEQFPCTQSTQLAASPLNPPRVSASKLPVPVGISLHINEIPEISDTRNQFVLDGLLTTTWCDPRATPESVDRDEHQVLYGGAAEDWLNTHWFPQVEFSNKVGESFYQTQSITLHSNGSIEYSRRLQENLGSDFSLNKFPFDNQSLLIQLQSFSWPRTVVKLISLGDVVSLGKSTRLPEWSIKGLTYRLQDHDDPEKGSLEYSRLQARINVSRKYGYYLYKIFIPLALLGFTSIFFLEIPIHEIADRLGFISGLLFTTLAYQLVITSNVPRVPYFTLGDTYTIVLFGFMIAEVLIAYIIHRTASKTKAKGIPTIERTMEIVLPITFGIFQITFITYALI
jgi:hypothetical protein